MFIEELLVVMKEFNWWVEVGFENIYMYMFEYFMYI